MSTPTLISPGLHHITAVAADPQRNLDFHTQVLGLRLVKLTVNFDDPSTYHFYFADQVGSPGSVLTFFPWEGIGPGTPGAGEATATSFAIPANSLAFWQSHLKEHNTPFSPSTRFGENLLALKTPDGLSIELIEHDQSSFIPALSDTIPPEHAIRGFHSVTLRSRRPDSTTRVLTEVLGYRLLATEGDRQRFHSTAAGFVDLVPAAPGEKLAQLGAGSVHHVAFRSSAADHVRFAGPVTAHGLRITPPQERCYFRSLYFREPGGVLFEIATDTPGFATDESLDSLGTSLKLPPWLESQREVITPTLPKLILPKNPNSIALAV